MSPTNKCNELLDAAERVTRRDGSANLTLEAVAAEAGLSKGGLLYHFPNKEALISAMLERMLSYFDTAHASAMEQDSSIPGRWTRAYIQTSLTPTGQIDDYDRTSIGLLAAIANNPSLVNPMRQRYSQWRSQINNDGIPAENAAVAALAADGLWMADLFGFAAPTGEERRRIIEKIIALTRGQD